MAVRPIAVVVLAAGLGTRMKSDLPKVMHPLGGRPMIKHLMATIAQLRPEQVVVVIGPEMEAVAQAVAPYPTVIQQERNGTAGALRQAEPLLKDFTGDILVLNGDGPLISLDTLRALADRRLESDDPGVVVLGFEPADPSRYGRLVVGADGGLNAIVEWKDATPDQREIHQCNSGCYAYDGKRLWGWLARVDNQNAAQEFYITDVVGLARADGARCAHVIGLTEELLGINSRAELAEAEALVQAQLRTKAMENGVTLIAPETVFFCHDTVVGRDVVIWPNVIFGPGVTVGDRVVIKGFCHFEGATIDSDCEVGPYARLRPGADIGKGAHIGNFVEVKKSRIDDGAKVNHLSYIGDATVGAKANVGAGTITCNYDGFNKSQTVIGAGAFIGSNSALVAPVTIGDGAIVGAGSVVTRDVSSLALAVARGNQMEMPGWAERFREANKKT